MPARGGSLINPGLLWRDIRSAAPQNVLLNLSSGGLGQFGQKSVALRDFEMRQVISRELTQFSFGRGSPRLEDDKGMRGFAPLLVRHTHHRDFLHGRMPQEQSFNFNG